jgi:hypothetical protein
MRGRGRKGPSPLTRSYESNGGDVKIRGTALHVAEKYVQLARDAQSSGDRVAAENYLQHAEHYYRIVAAAQAQMPQPQPVVRSDDDGADEEDRESRDNGSGGERRAMYGGDQPAFGLSDPQPYFNGGDQEQAVNDAGALPESGSGRDRGPHMGGFRRRRPYRERYGDRAGEHGEQGRSDGGAGPPQADD